MNRTKIASNCYVGTSLNGVTVLFSYDTPVACSHPVHGLMRTERQWSRTTARHICQWLAQNMADNRSCEVQTMPQEYFDALIAS